MIFFQSEKIMKFLDILKYIHKNGYPLPTDVDTRFKYHKGNATLAYVLRNKQCLQYLMANNCYVLNAYYYLS